MPRNFSNIKSLLHFDFHYYAEPGDGLFDEVSSETWTRASGVKFMGNQIPYDMKGNPKFGYRAFYSSSSTTLLTATNNHGTFNINPTSGYEFAFFINASGVGNILALKKEDAAIFTLSLLSGGLVSINGTSSEKAIPLNSWAYLVIRFSGSKIFIYADGQEIISVDNSSSFQPDTLELGGFIGALDEFSARTDLSNLTVPTEPIQADFSMENPFGTGAQGNAAFSQSGCFNSYVRISSASGSALSILAWTVGQVGTISFNPKIGDEVFIHVCAKKGSDENLLGRYSFRHIAGMSAGLVVLDKPVNEFSLPDALENYHVQMVLVPNFNKLEISPSCTISPLKFSDNPGGGIVLFRALDSAKIQGKIISSGFGPVRNDLIQMTHSKLASQFIMNTGGGIFIGARYLEAPSSARIGGDFSGSGLGGAGGVGEYHKANPGASGGSGYGGGGGGWTGGSWGYRNGGAGGVGGGGGHGGGSTTDKSHAGTGGNAGDTGTTGGHYGWGNNKSGGGTQGVTAGGNGTGGGGAGGTGSNNATVSGANVFIIAQTLSLDEAALSTGGAGGAVNRSGGGTGFCYMAVKEMI